MNNKTSLTIKVTFMLVALYSVLLLFLFIPAGTFKFYEGWSYFVVFFLGANILTFYFLIKDPELIERRTKPEKEKTQVIIQSLNGIMFLALMTIPGLNYRFNWTNVPFWLVITAIVMVAFGFLIVFFVFKQNSFLGSNVQAYENQKLVTTGLYSVVRHPMYSGAYFIILFTPLALGSFLALLPAIVIGILIIVRTINEENVLSKDLKGYKEYCEKTRYRYFPLIW